MNSSAYPRFVVQLDQMRQPQLLDVFLCHFLECYAWLYSCSIILENEYNFFYQVAPYQLIIKMFNLRNCMIIFVYIITPVHQLLKSFASLGPPTEESEEECSIMHGLTSAVQCLCEPTPQNSKNNQANKKPVREGRIICVTNLKRSEFLLK